MMRLRYHKVAERKQALIAILLPFVLAACVGRQEAGQLAQQLTVSSKAAKVVITDIKDRHQDEVDAHKRARSAFLVADSDRRKALLGQAVAEMEAAYQEAKGQMYQDYADAIRGVQADAVQVFKEAETNIQMNADVRELEVQVRIADARAQEAHRRSANGSNAEKLSATLLTAQALGLSSEYNRIQEEAGRKVFGGINTEVSSFIEKMNAERDNHLKALQAKFDEAKASMQKSYTAKPAVVETVEPASSTATATPAAGQGTELIERTVTGIESPAAAPVKETNLKLLSQKVQPLYTEPSLLGPEPTIPESAYDALIDYQDEVATAGEGFQEYLNKNSLIAIVSSATDGLLAGLKKGISYKIRGETDPIKYEDFKKDGQELVTQVRGLAEAELKGIKDQFKEKLDDEVGKLKDTLKTKAQDAINEALKTLPVLNSNGG